MKALRLIIVGLVLAALLAGDLAMSFVFAEDRVHVSQQQEQPRRRRTLMDLLFGEPEPPRQQQQEQPRRRRPANTGTSPSVATLPPPKPAVEKAANATRVAIMGDSMAVDLGKAMERFYAEDPNLVVVPMGVGSSGFVRDDFFDWNKTISDQIAANSFDLAVMIIGINDRQELKVNGQTYPSLSEEWTKAYRARLDSALNQLRTANKPVIWIGLPPMEQPTYSSALAQINGLQRLASLSGGAEFLDIFERFADENGRYSSFGPDLSGNSVQMRKGDGIHFSNAGSDKLAYYVNEAIGKFYSGGGLSVEIADPLLGTDAQMMLRAPFQGLGQVRQLEVAGAVMPLSAAPERAMDMVIAPMNAAPAGTDFDLSKLMQAPVGRADAFGVGITPEQAQAAREATGPQS